MNFFKDVQNVAKTRKFWVGLGGAVLQASIYYLGDYEEFSPIVALVTALGIYQIKNTSK